MTLRLYDTMTRAKRVFEPLDSKNVRVYVCGPTVYDLAHVGNARSVVVFDVLFRLLRHLYGAAQVTYARNITDVDDKIIDAARATGEPIDSITARTTEAFHADMAALGALEPSVEPRATRHIAQMIALIETLIERGHAYEADGHVLFSVPSMADYGKLSRHSQDELIAGARVEVAPYKREATDFVLWKPSTEDQPGWDSPWANPWGTRGRPGWHIECSAMSAHHLGPAFDIHGGGQDLIFPHHENEIAQSRCAHPEAAFARYWMHNGYVVVEGEKMSKSLGNFFTVRDLLAEEDWGPEYYKKGEAIRLALLTAHYRQPLDFTHESLDQARNTLDYWYKALFLTQDAGISPDETQSVPIQVIAALEDDLNTPLANLRLGELANELHKANQGGDKQQQRQLSGQLLAAGQIVGFLEQDPKFWFKGPRISGSGDLRAGSASVHGVGRVYPSEDWIEDCIKARAAARQAKDFAEADRIRDELKANGIILEDRPDGTTDWRRSG